MHLWMLSVTGVTFAELNPHRSCVRFSRATTDTSGDEILVMACFVIKFHALFNVTTIYLSIISLKLLLNFGRTVSLLTLTVQYKT